jgi:hypothetical protein
MKIEKLNDNLTWVNNSGIKISIQLNFIILYRYDPLNEIILVEIGENFITEKWLGYLEDGTLFYEFKSREHLIWNIAEGKKYYSDKNLWQVIYSRSDNNFVLLTKKIENESLTVLSMSGDIICRIDSESNKRFSYLTLTKEAIIIVILGEEDKFGRFSCNYQLDLVNCAILKMGLAY